MYRVLLKKPNMAKNTYCLYTVVQSETDEEGNVTKQTVPYEANDLTELAEKYKELLETYNKSQIFLVDELDVDLIVNVSDVTDK